MKNYEVIFDISSISGCPELNEIMFSSAFGTDRTQVCLGLLDKLELYKKLRQNGPSGSDLLNRVTDEIVFLKNELVRPNPGHAQFNIYNFLLAYSSIMNIKKIG